jgi:magnesium chelatase subunit ChlI-like protein
MMLCMTQLNLSARAYHRILKLARTIADLAGCEEIRSVHLAEALQVLVPLFIFLAHASHGFAIQRIHLCMFALLVIWPEDDAELK